MPYNILNKKEWLKELDALVDKYVDLIINNSEVKKDFSTEIVITTRYKYSDLIFTGREIVEAIQKRLADDKTYIYEFRTVDNISVVNKSFRVVFDQEVVETIKEDFKNINKENNQITLEELKSKYIETKRENEDLKLKLKAMEDKNYELYLENVDVIGGLYNYAKKKKLILMLSKIIKENGLYDDEKGTEYSFLDLKVEEKIKIVKDFYNKTFKK